MANRKTEITKTQRMNIPANKQRVVKPERMTTVSPICCDSPVDAGIQKYANTCMSFPLSRSDWLSLKHTHPHPASLKAGVTAWLLR